MTPSEAELKSLVCRLFLEGDTDFPITSDTLLLEEGICDSMGVVELAAALQKDIPGLTIHDQEITREHFGSIGLIRSFLEGKEK